MATPETCPECGADLKGEPIPLESRYFYKGKEWFDRVIALYDRGRDRTTHWKCPDCGHVWERR